MHGTDIMSLCARVRGVETRYITRRSCMSYLAHISPNCALARRPFPRRDQMKAHDARPPTSASRGGASVPRSDCALS